jgi:hypothetical protein
MGDEAGRREQRAVALPFRGDEWGSLRLPHPLSAREWDYLLGLLAAMRPGLVRDEAAGGGRDGD